MHWLWSVVYKHLWTHGKYVHKCPLYPTAESKFEMLKKSNQAQKSNPEAFDQA